MNPIEHLLNDPNVSDKFKDAIEISAPLEDAVMNPKDSENCDFCGAKMEPADYDLGVQYSDGRWACLKCYEQSNDVIE